MNSTPVKGIILVFLFVLGIAAGLSIIGLNFFSRVDSNGAVLDSPVFFIILILTGAMTILLLHWMYSRREEKTPFSSLALANSIFSSILIGGIVHELVHFLLIAHPTQFRIHFGDVNAVFSTCCLSPGELPYEEIAYLIQFLVMASWVYFTRNTFFVPANGTKIVKGKMTMGKKEESESKTKAEKDENCEERMVEEEWQKERKWMHSKLDTKSSRSKKIKTKKGKGFEDLTLESLDKLKIKHSR